MTVWGRIGIAGMALMLIAESAQAQDARVEMLERQLADRDKVMLELLERVEFLEQRLGVTQSARDTPEEQAAPTTAGTAPPAPGTAPPAPGTVVVDAQTAERALERSLSREGALLLRSGVLEIEPSIGFARQEDVTPSFVNLGGGVVAGETERNANRYTADLSARLGLPWGAQLELGVPYRRRHVKTVTNVGFAPTTASSQTGHGLGDVRVGLAKTLLREGRWRPDLIGRVTWNTDSGRRQDNGVSLGGGFHELQGALTAIKRQDPVVLIGSVSYQHTFEKSQIQPGPVVAMNLGAALAVSPETSLRMFVSAAYQDDAEVFGSKIDGSDRTIGTFVVGGSTLLAPGVLLNATLGVGLTDDADDFSLILSLPIRFNTPLF